VPTPKLTFVLALLAALVTSWILFSERHLETTYEKERAALHLLPRLMAREVASIRLKRDSWTSAAVERIDGATFKRTEPSAAAVDSPPILAALSELEFAEHSAVLRRDGRDETRLYDEGLAKPRLIVTLTLADQRTLEFDVGKQTPTADGVYVHLRDADDVLVASKKLCDQLDQLLDAWTKPPPGN
jgi:hypothetical protein